MRTTIMLSSCVALLACSGSDPTPKPTTQVVVQSALDTLRPVDGHNGNLTQKLAPVIADSRVPGASVALVKGDVVMYAHGFGLADPATGRAMTTDTSVQIQSISKVVIAASLMQLWEHGKFGLDDDVDGYLPYSVRNPAFTNVPITFRMLLAHASTIQDGNETGPNPVGTLPPLSLADYVKSYLLPGGANYSADGSFLATNAPGTVLNYTDEGFTLLGELLEILSGESVESYTQEHIFEPLDMRAKWNEISPTDRRVGPPALPYAYDPTTDTMSPVGGLYTIDAWPAGAVSTDVVSLSHFMGALINDGSWRGGRILKPTTVRMMKAIQYPQLEDPVVVGSPYEALGCEVYQPPYTVFDDHQYLGHWGVNAGYALGFWMRPDLHAGAILMTNSDIMAYGGQPFADALSIIEGLLAASENE